MKKGSIYLIVAGLIVFVSSCAVKMQTYDLAEEYATSLHYEGASIDDGSVGEEESTKSEMVGVLASSFYGGDLKRGAIWWTGKDITLEKGEEFIFEAENVGPDSIPFGATFPPLDLIKEEVRLKISARAEGEGESPTLYLQVDDADGFMTNAIRPFQKIENSEEFKDYYFSLKDIYTQVTPKKHKVNGAMINSLKFFINPGQVAYTGLIYIKEIKIVPAEKPAE
jgi:hypothetical protein